MLRQKGEDGHLVSQGAPTEGAEVGRGGRITIAAVSPYSLEHPEVRIQIGQIRRIWIILHQTNNQLLQAERLLDTAKSIRTSRHRRAHASCVDSERNLGSMKSPS